MIVTDPEHPLDLELRLRGMTAAELARRARVRAATISDWRTGKKRPHARTVARISIALSRVPLLPPEDLKLLGLSDRPAEKTRSSTARTSGELLEEVNGALHTEDAPR